MYFDKLASVKSARVPYSHCHYKPYEPLIHGATASRRPCSELSSEPTASATPLILMSAPFSQNNKAIRLIEPPQTKQRHKRLAHTRDVNELPLVNSLLAPESYLLLSTTLLSQSSAGHKSAAKSCQTTRQHEKFYSKHRSSYSPQPRTAENIR